MVERFPQPPPIILDAEERLRSLEDRTRHLEDAVRELIVQFRAARSEDNHGD